MIRIFVLAAACASFGGVIGGVVAVAAESTANPQRAAVVSRSKQVVDSRAEKALVSIDSRLKLLGSWFQIAGDNAARNANDLWLELIKICDNTGGSFCSFSPGPSTPNW